MQPKILPKIDGAGQQWLHLHAMQPTAAADCVPFSLDGQVFENVSHLRV